MKKEYKVSLDEWYHILHTMIQYSRTTGYLAIVHWDAGEMLTYFDSKPNEFISMPITIEQVREYIQSYDH
jgi:hypothetical protein